MKLNERHLRAIIQEEYVRSTLNLNRPRRMRTRSADSDEEVRRLVREALVDEGVVSALAKLGGGIAKGVKGTAKFLGMGARGTVKTAKEVIDALKKTDEEKRIELTADSQKLVNVVGQQVNDMFQKFVSKHGKGDEVGAQVAYAVFSEITKKFEIAYRTDDPAGTDKILKELDIDTSVIKPLGL